LEKAMKKLTLMLMLAAVPQLHAQAQTHPRILQATAWVTDLTTEVVAMVFSRDGTGKLLRVPSETGLDGNPQMRADIIHTSAIVWWVQEGNTLCIRAKADTAKPLCATALVKSAYMEWDGVRYNSVNYKTIWKGLQAKT
jgi:hypothetical protein